MNIAPAILAFLLVGCASSGPAWHPPLGFGAIPEFGAGRERAGDRAPEWITEKALVVHARDKRAPRYPHLEFCQSRSEGPGFEAKFTIEPGGFANITHYFDNQGRYVARREILCVY